jgi:hypothetical protein
MKVFPYVVSGIGFLVLLPFAGLMVAFAHDSPNPSPLDEILKGALVITLLAIPLVWLVSLVISLIVVRRKVGTADEQGADILQEFMTRKSHEGKKARLLKFCALSPYFAAALHLSVWIIALVVPR